MTIPVPSTSILSAAHECSTAVLVAICVLAVGLKPPSKAMDFMDIYGSQLLVESMASNPQRIARAWS